MKKIFSFCLSILFISTSLFAQNEFAATILEFAEINVQAIKENDMDNRIALVHPNLIAMGGGAESYKSILEAETKMMKEHKFKILSAEFGVPGEIVTAGPELHCILTQTLFIEFAGEPAEESTNLLVVSLDDGKTWKFVDLNQHDTTSIKIFFPYYNDKLLSALDK